jgi:phage-related protein
MDGGNVIFKFLGDDKGLQKTIGGLGKVGKVALATFATGFASVATGFTAIVTESVKARAEMEQLVGGAKKIFDEIDYAMIEKDAQEAYKTMNLSAAEYIEMMNSVGATFAATMGDERGYNTAKKGMQALADYASGTGASIENLNEKYKLITRSATSYQSIADQFAGILPQTKKDFLAQAQAAGFLSKKYKELTQVPVAEYQEAITKMIEKGVDDMGLLGNTLAETENTFTGSLAAMKKAWDNFLSGQGDLGTVAETTGTFIENLTRILDEVLPQIATQLEQHAPAILALVSKVFDIISSAVDTFAPQISEITVQIMGITANAIISTIPTLLLAISDAIGQLLMALTEANTKFWTAALTWLANLAGGIMAGIGQALLAIANVCTAIVSGALSFIGNMIKAGWDLIVGLGKGIANGASNALSSLKNVLSKIWEAIKGKFTEVKDNAGNWGRDMMTGFINGIMGKLAELRERVRQIADNIRAQLHFSRPDEGPLRDYETWMPDMIKGMAASLDKAAPILTNKVRALTMDMSPTLNGSYGSYTPNVNVTVNSNYETDPLGQMVNTIKTFSNGAKNDYNYGYGG